MDSTELDANIPTNKLPARRATDEYGFYTDSSDASPHHEQRFESWIKFSSRERRELIKTEAEWMKLMGDWKQSCKNSSKKVDCIDLIP